MFHFNNGVFVSCSTVLFTAHFGLNVCGVCLQFWLRCVVWKVVCGVLRLLEGFSLCVYDFEDIVLDYGLCVDGCVTMVSFWVMTISNWRKLKMEPNKRQRSQAKYRGWNGEKRSRSRGTMTNYRDVPGLCGVLSYMTDIHMNGRMYYYLSWRCDDIAKESFRGWIHHSRGYACPVEGCSLNALINIFIALIAF